VDVESTPGAYLTLERVWEDGDTIEINLPMALRVEAMPDDPQRAAILYGPIVLAGALGMEGLPEGGAFSDNDEAYLEAPVPPVPALAGESARVAEWVRPVAGDPLTFHTVDAGRPRDVVLKPFYRLHHERYTVYWKLMTEDE
jgi:DUF1680 family protein